jgi:hypothetical protein
MKYVFKLGSLEARASSSSLIMSFKPSRVLDRAQARLNFLIYDPSEVQVQFCEQPLYIYLK